MKTNESGLALIRQFEGCRLKAYKCPAGVWTIGYGWTHGVKPTDQWTQAQAEEMLVKGLDQYENAVQSAIGAHATTSNQFSALVSICYNIGAGNFVKSSMLRHHKAGDYAKAADAFLLWNKAGGKVLNGLTKRRQAERALYLED
jgi:lysozyme